MILHAPNLAHAVIKAAREREDRDTQRLREIRDRAERLGDDVILRIVTELLEERRCA